MTCAEVEARFVDLVDGRVDPVASVRVHAHIEGCVDCRDRAALWRKLVPGLRGIEPAPMAPAAVRRMQLEVERLVAWEAPASPPRRAPRLWRPALFGLVGAAAALALWLHGFHRSRAPMPPSPSDEPAFAAVDGLVGAPTVDGRRFTSTTRVAAGSEIALAGGSQIELHLARGAHLRLAGPARAVLGGTPRDVAITLEQGSVEAEVAHRRPDETFAIRTGDLRVEVRGTKFSVGVGATGSWVRVVQGRVAVRFADGRETFVSTGETTQSASPELAPRVAPFTAGAPPHCGETVRACEGTTRAARQSMRSGDADHALRLVAAGSRVAREADGECAIGADGPSGAGGKAAAGGLTACEDELRYLRAEALHQAGRLDDAVAAYRALDRHGAPAATRQNALYAAAQIEERRGLVGQARADYERALAAAPRGALCEEALVGAMESAQVAGDIPGARVLAARYLDQFPRGLHAASARRLAAAGPRR